VSIWLITTASFAFKNNAPSSASAANDMTALIIVDNTNIAPLFGVECWRSSISVLVLILTLVSTGRGRQNHLASKIPFYLL